MHDLWKATLAQGLNSCFQLGLLPWVPHVSFVIESWPGPSLVRLWALAQLCPWWKILHLCPVYQKEKKMFFFSVAKWIHRSIFICFRVELAADSHRTADWQAIEFSIRYFFIILPTHKSKQNQNFKCQNCEDVEGPVLCGFWLIRTVDGPLPAGLRHSPGWLTLYSLTFSFTFVSFWFVFTLVLTLHLFSMSLCR